MQRVSFSGISISKKKTEKSLKILPAGIQFFKIKNGDNRMYY